MEVFFADLKTVILFVDFKRADRAYLPNAGKGWFT
jgi:hypothetical protein